MNKGLRRDVEQKDAIIATTCAENKRLATAVEQLTLEK
jgi:hypothetical protein